MVIHLRSKPKPGRNVITPAPILPLKSNKIKVKQRIENASRESIWILNPAYLQCSPKGWETSSSYYLEGCNVTCFELMTMMALPPLWPPLWGRTDHFCEI